MDSGIEFDAPLDYSTIQIFPAENRYEVFVCADDEVEKLACGLLEQLLPHLPGVNNLYREGSDANFKLQVAELHDKTWFTKSTLNRFFKIIASPDLVDSNKLIEAEISQLEEARKFHLPLYTEEHEDGFENGETDRCSSIGTVPTSKAEAKIASSDTSKDELLKAIDLRLTALRKELAAALNQAAGLTCSSKDVRNLIDFCDHFGVADLMNSLCKLLQLSHKSETSVLDTQAIMIMSRSDKTEKTNEDTQISRSTNLRTPVKYGVSPAVVAQVERQSSTESEKSSYSSDENQISAERSRALSRSAQPRRSASPMRRIQIGRSGSRRAPALTIKSLGHYPGRERTLTYGDADSNCSENEGSERISKKPQNDVRRISVQDAISLFERKQKDQSATQKRSSNPSLCTNKSVLRRWSAGTTECSATCQPEVVSEDPVPLSRETVATQGYSNCSGEGTLESNFTSAGEMTIKTDVSLKGSEIRKPDPVDTEKVANATKEQNTNRISTLSAEWSQQKEAELNQMRTKLMDNQRTKARKPQTSRNQNVSSEHRGGFYDHYKEKRDEKLRAENARKKAEKDARFRAMQQTLDEQKAAMASRSVKVVGKNNPSPKPQKSLNNSPQPANPKSESSKASAERKPSSRASTLPTTRKSWPSMPSTRVSSSSPSNIPAGLSSAGTTPTHRKPLSTPSLPRSTAKVERTQPRQRNVGERESNNRRPKVTEEKKQRTVRKPEKRAETKAAASPRDCSGTVTSKPSFYNKMTKKGSVVPLESRPFLRKGSGIASVKSKSSSQLEETSTNSGNMVETRDHEVVVNTSIPEIHHDDQDVTSVEHANAATETVMNNSCENSNDCVTDGNDNLKDTMESSTESSTKIHSQEESVISPAAWEEIDDNQNIQNSNYGGSSELASPIHITPVGLSSPHIRHSLSQMLQEESSEADAVEWGNAENPPAKAYQKHSPKGLKRLLKFARKSKGDANLLFSEEEDDSEESKVVSKRNTDNISRKVTHHSKNYGQQTGSFLVSHEKNIDPHQLLSAQSNKTKISTAASTTKASRSFFSLSAFRGSKPNEAKFH
ncbi:flocculation protein FLO11-like isoform X2 [Euphorbia lathyris]|uniref:flocculation protein FLO11-like isoform X2 n=1 Tax=Euphorbia lathyris TaxID=212925 RepID=UPI00331408A3